MIEKIPDDSEILRHLKSTSDFELIELEFLKVAVDQQEGQAIVLMSGNNKSIGFDLNSIEGTIFSFVKSGCSLNSHIKNIYQMYLETMSMIKFKLDTVVIESKSGDMVYSRLKWKDHKDRTITQLCSVGDGLVLSTICDVPIYITNKALDDMDDYSHFHEEFEIQDDEE